MKISKRDIGRAVIFQGFTGAIHEGYIEDAKTTECGYAYVKVNYRVAGYSDPFIAIVSKPNLNRLAFRVTA